MAKYIIDSSTLTGLADALRKVTGENRTYTPTEMIDAVTTIMDSATYILVDEDGNEYPAVYVDNEVVFTATANDIRIGKVAATDTGVTEGTKEIPAYHTYDGFRVIPSGDNYYIPHDKYDYTNLQSIICAYNTTVSNSVAAIKIVIEDNVYDPGSTDSISVVTKDDENSRVDLGISNDSGGICILRYIMYKEIY